uniref:Uncharacterized protein n=1 Tax=viral metagenome TaxID=1070528 RepID=A0A6M3XX70_9ZZZZ
MDNDQTTMTRVLSDSHKKVSIYATDKNLHIPDAYDLIVNAGLKALNYKLPES